MKASRFNIIASLDNSNKVLFNSRTGAMAELDPASYEQVSALLEDPDSDGSAGNSQLCQQLLYGGFLVDDDIDELANQKVEHRRHRYGRNMLSLAISPTFDCNLTCSSCDSKRHGMKMTALVEKALLKFADAHIRKADDIKVTWFGGEPLLGVETIERLQGHFAASAAQYGVNLNGATIITNGTLLDIEMAKRLKTAGVSCAQVTLNGSRIAHDQSRGLSDGGSCFDRIIDNIAQSADILDIVVRINNVGDATGATEEVVGHLHESNALSKVRVYLVEAPQTGGACADVIGRCRQSEKSLKKTMDSYTELKLRSRLQMTFPYLLAEESCPTDSDSSFIVASTGYIFKCWEDVSASVDKSVGTIFDDNVEPFQQSNLRKYVSYDFMEKSECESCAILPICMGGCAHDICEQTERMSGKCSFWKDNFQNLLRLRYLYETREEVSS